jgi:ComEC/Rec2-related protein
MLRLPLVFLAVSVSLSAVTGAQPIVVICVLVVAVFHVFLSRKPFALIFAVLGLILGSLSFQSFMDDSKLLSGNGFREVTLRAAGFPDGGPDGKWHLDCSGGVRVSGGDELSSFAPGDCISMRGYAASSVWKSREWKTFRETEIVSSHEGLPPLEWASRMRKAIAEKIDVSPDEDLHPLLHALILGNTAYLDYGILQSFRLTGVTHLLAISGLNVAIAGAAVFLLFRKLFGEQAALFASCVAAVLCVTAAGFGASASRAGVMYVIGSLLRATGRTTETSDSLLLVGAGMLACFPVLSKDVGFWLSFLAVGGLVYLTEPCRAPLDRLARKLPFPLDRTGEWTSELLGTSLSASLATLPVILYIFGGVSVLSLFANLFVIPAFNLLTLSVYAHFGLLWTGLPWIEFPCALLERILWSFTRAVTDLLSLVPWGYRTAEGFTFIHLLVSYALLFAVFFGLPRMLYVLRRRAWETKLLRLDTVKADTNSEETESTEK